MRNKEKKHTYGKVIIISAFSVLISLTPITNMTLPINHHTIEVQAATLGETNALEKAKLYLDTMPFSKKGLVKQLKFDGFSAKEAKYGANKCKANWKKQAAKKAKLYLETQPFSKTGLIKQLKFDGFTAKQAKYGAKKAGY